MSVDLLGTENQLLIDQGEYKEITVVFKNSKTKEEIDLTDIIVFFGVKSSTNDRIPLILKTSEDDEQIAIENPRSGEAKIYLKTEDTENLDEGEYIYSIWFQYSNGQKKPALKKAILLIEKSVINFS